MCQYLHLQGSFLVVLSVFLNCTLFASNFSELASGRSHSVGALLKKKEEKRKEKKRLDQDVLDTFFRTFRPCSWRQWYKLRGTKWQHARSYFSRHYNIDFEQTGPEIELKAVGTSSFCLFVLIFGVCVCVRASVRACERACVRACVRVCVWCVLKKDFFFFFFYLTPIDKAYAASSQRFSFSQRVSDAV